MLKKQERKERVEGKQIVRRVGGNESEFGIIYSRFREMVSANGNKQEEL